jgi:hypothetical protein
MVDAADWDNPFALPGQIDSRETPNSKLQENSKFQRPKLPEFDA